MKKFLLLLSLYFCMVVLVFAQSLELSTSEQEVAVGQSFMLTLQAKDIPLLTGITIDGLKDFEVIDMKSLSQDSLSLQLSPKIPGNILIGPAHMKLWSGTIVSNSLQVSIWPSFEQWKEQLKGPQNIEKPIFPWKNIVRMLAAIFGCFLVWKLWMRWNKQAITTPRETIVASIHARPTPELGKQDWLTKIPKQDDPLFAENSEHLIRNYLQRIWNTNVYHLTYQELLQLNNYQTGKLRVDMEALRRALMLLQRARYAKLDLDSQGLEEQMVILFEKHK